MKPEIPCPNHPDLEGFHQCRYCGKSFCELCVQNEPGFYRCQEPSCLQAYQAEIAGPQRFCPFCGQNTPRIFPFCVSCGEKLPALRVKDPDSPVTVAKFASVTDADLARAKLFSQGIESFVADEAINTLYASGNIFTGGVRLQTRVADSQKALELLDLSETTSGSCRYCGEVLNESEFNSDLGILHCLKPQCLTAYQAEVKSLTRLCPSCGKEITYPNFICGNCGKKLKEIPVTLEPMELSPTPSSQDEKWKLGWAVLLWFFFFSIDLVPSSIYCGLNYWQGILPDVLSARWVSTLSELMCVFLTLFLVKNFKNLSWLESINFLGFKSMNPRQLLAGALILIPILASEFLALQGYQKEGVLVLLKRDWVGRAIHILVGAGFFEEILYRGFLFQCLRRGRSFFSAAILASGLWALSHLSHLIPFYGPEHESFDQTLSLMFRVFVDGLLGAYLFEKGGNNIWGWMLVHVGYDSCSLMNTQGGDFYASSLPENFSDMGDWSSVLLTVPIILWLLPAWGKGTNEPRNRNDTSPFLANEVSKRWKPIFLSSILFSTVVLAQFLSSAQKLSETASNNYWQKFIDSHPRYADGYRKWADDFWRRKEIGEAEEKCQQALEIDPKNYKAWILWGKILRYKTQYVDAAQKFQKAAESEPRKAAAYLWWGHVLEWSDKKDDALQKYRMALLLNPQETYFIDYANERIYRLQSKR